MKKIISLFMAICFLSMIPTTVLADSGYSTMPKETPAQKYCYTYIAPKTQTTYKKIYSKTTSVKSIIKTGNQIKATAGTVTLSMGALGNLTPIPPVQVIAKTVSGSASFVTLYAKQEVDTLSKFKKNTKYVTNVYFKWTDAQTLKYSVKIQSYYTYNGKRVSAITNQIKTGQYK